MSRAATSGGALLLFCHLTFASISNWIFDTSEIYLPGDSISFSCASDADTITTSIYLETGDSTSEIDTTTDILLYSITMIDNYTGEAWKENRGVLDDADPLKGKFGFNPGCPGLAPGIYRMLITDRTCRITKTFRVAGFPEPYRVITGTVSVPPGMPPAWNSVALGSETAVFTLSGWTDAIGAYRIAIDKASLEKYGNNMTAYVESRYCGFITTPARFRLDLAANNWNEVNFSFVSATALLRGTTLLANCPAPNIRVSLADSMHNIIALSISDDGGAYAISCPPGAYLISAGNPDNNRPAESTEKTVLIADHDTIDLDLPLSYTDVVSALPAGRELKGNGILQLTVIDSTMAMVDKGAIMVWDGQPARGTSARPLRIFPLQKLNANLTLVEIPDQKCCISVELSGSTLGSDCRYSAFAADRRGMRRMFDYTDNDTLRCTITLREKDRAHTGWGGGSIQGRVVTDLQRERTHVAVLLYDIDRTSVERGCTAESDGTFRIGTIPIGAYRVAAAIDTNNDKSPDVTTMADTTFIFTGKESHSGVIITFSEKPAGAFRINGQLTGIGAIPENVVLTVAALPIDTMTPAEARLNITAFMMAYRAPVQSGGSFVIENLPPGAYYVAAAAEEKDSASGIARELAFGIYGDMLLNRFTHVPVTPRPVIISDNTPPPAIVISLIVQNRNDGNPLISGRKLRIPSSFALQSAHIDAAGTVRIEFAVPQPTTAAFLVDNMAGHTIAALPEATFSPGFHAVTIKVDRHTPTATAPLFVSMKSAVFRTRQAITPLKPLRPEASSSAFPGRQETDDDGER